MSLPCPACGYDNPDGMKFCGECGARLVTAPAGRSESRKLVTILFADVAGSTALGERLDPEALRSLMGRYFATMRAIVERHGGTVEKFIGDAVMAVFGIPELHEDDALRAVRAAVEIRDALAELNQELENQRGITIRFRTGVTTGEVVVGDPASGTTLVTGDTVNTAARLEQAARPGEVLIGRVTYTLVRDAVEAEPVEPVLAKGKSEPLSAYRLTAVHAGVEGRTRRLDTPLVGRERELHRLEQAFQQAVDDRSCQLFTVLGLAGVGKSRLVAEFLDTIAGDATILRGRCLSYGDGITFWPVRELVHQAAGIVDSDAAEEARAKLGAMFGDARDAASLADTLASALALRAEPTTHEDLEWAVRRLFERLAADRPLVVVIEDIHWAEPTLLDLVEHLVDWSRDAPLLVLCPARPELLERRQAWGGGKLNATTILLEPLPTSATERLIALLPGGEALPAPMVDRITAAADGNALYVEELVAMLVDDGAVRQEPGGRWVATRDLGEVRVPPSISALLAARLDRLAVSERDVAQRASVVGRVFEGAAVTELSPDDARDQVRAALRALIRKELIRRERTDGGPAEVYKFRHLLLRDAAYDALPKSERARLHLRFADWLEATAGDRLAEQEELVGYHLEQVHRYRSELGEAADTVEPIAARAAARLGSSGERAYASDDYPAATRLLERAIALTVDPGARGRLGLTLATSLRWEERPREAVIASRRAIEDAIQANDERTVAMARLYEVWTRISLGEAKVDDLRAAIDPADAVARRFGDERLLARVALFRSNLLSSVGQERESIAATKDALRHATASGDARGISRAIAFIADGYAIGSEPVDSAIDELEDLLPQTRTSLASWIAITGALAMLHAMAGHRERALVLMDERNAVIRERGGPFVEGPHYDGYVAMVLGDPELALELLTRTFESTLASGDASVANLLGALLIEVLLDAGSVEQAAATSGRIPPATDAADSSADLHTARSRLSLVQGDVPSALASARVAVDIFEPTDWLQGRGYAWWRMADARLASGDRAGAREAAMTALANFDQKGDVVSAGKVRQLLQGLAEEAGAEP